MALSQVIEHKKTTPAVSAFRNDIQGLRTIAVATVVIYHLWPGRLPGGFVGVDIFFVISGFLITSHLWREVVTKGSISLRSFYARRALRLLPASLLVLVLTAVAALLVVPIPQWASTFRQLVASAFYLQNWILATDAVDYLAQHNAASPAQHYWSLSVEEQFYAFWPLLIIVSLWVLAKMRRRMRPDIRMQVVAGVLCLLTLVSLAFSIYYTAADPKQAYFVTPTRVWEFATGAIVALVWTENGRFLRTRSTTAWVGLTAIAVSAVTYSAATPFPSYTALLPVLGTAAVLMGVPATSPRHSSWWLSRRPMVAVGDISYAVYLWHWPLIILLPMATSHALSFRERLMILAATLVLAWLSTHFFEAPLRANPWIRSRRRFSLAIAIGGAAAVSTVALVAGGLVQAQLSQAQAQYQTASQQPCHGAAALSDPSCGPAEGSGPLMSPALAAEDRNNPDYTRCDQSLDNNEVLVCEWGPSDASKTVALVGDSHATQWLGAAVALANDNKWRLRTYLKSSCPLTDAVRVLASEPEQRQTNCLKWQDEVKQQLIQDTSIDYVFTASYARAYGFTIGQGVPVTDSGSVATRGFQSVWKDLVSSGKEVFVLRDTPGTLMRTMPDCAANNTGNLQACSAPRGMALLPDPTYEAALSGNSPSVHALDLSDGFCDATTCHGVLGNVIVYRDTDHMTWQFAATMAPRLYAAFEAARK